MPMMMHGSIGLQVVDLLLLGILIFIYSKNLMKVKSNFTVGLLIFAGFLFIENLAGLYLGFMGLGFMNEHFESYAFFTSLSETVALLALFFISLK